MNKEDVGDLDFFYQAVIKGYVFVVGVGEGQFFVFLVMSQVQGYGEVLWESERDQIEMVQIVFCFIIYLLVIIGMDILVLVFRVRGDSFIVLWDNG